MKTFVVIMTFDVCTALPFAFYICRAALTDSSVSPAFVKAYAALLVVVLALSLVALGSADWTTAVGGFVVRQSRWWKLW